MPVKYIINNSKPFFNKWALLTVYYNIQHVITIIKLIRKTSFQTFWESEIKKVQIIMLLCVIVLLLITYILSMPRCSYL